MNFLQLSASGSNKAWKYIITLIVTFLGTQLASAPLGIVMFLSKKPLAELMQTNLGLALMLLPFLGGLIALLVCVRFLHEKPILSILTARKKLDFNRVFWGIGIWGVIMLISTFVSYMMSDNANIVFQYDGKEFWMLVLVALILLPFQTSFEEIVFRGYLTQLTALIGKKGWIALIVPSLLFAFLHIANPEVDKFGIGVAMSQYITMGLFFGFITIWDDGLELALGVHFINNFMAAITVTSDSSALQTHALFKDLDPSISYNDTLLLFIYMIIFILISNLKFGYLKNKERNIKILGKI